MSYCLNPQCQKPFNADETKFCQSCGSKLWLGDRYRSQQPLSQGGFGRTFLAVDEWKPSQPRCVIKQFFPRTESTETSKKAAELFRNEAIRLEQLGHHPQIAELLAYFEQENRQYLVQEFIEGKNLDRELAEQGAFTEIQIRQLLTDLLLVLRFIHENQIIHRDIKPSNIIRRTSSPSTYQDAGKIGQLVLVDFGAAKLITGIALELTGTVIGSAGYTAPEQLLGKAVFASDLYSLGVTCIHLLTQIHPVDLFDIKEGIWIWRERLRHPVSRELGQVLDKLLARPTGQRYQSVEEVLENLDSHPVTLLLPTTTLLPPSTSQPTQTWKYVGTIYGHSTPVLAVAMSPDGQTLASSSQNGTIKLWSLGNQVIEAGLKSVPSRTFSGGSSAVPSIAFSPDGQILVSGDRDGNIKLWHYNSGELANSFSGHSSPIQAIAISPDGQLIASAGDNKNIKVWRFGTQELLYTLKGQYRINSITLSPDSKMLASGCQDETIKLWSLRTGKIIQTLQRPSGSAYAVAFSPDGKVVAGGGQGRKIHLWDLETGELIHSLISNLYAVRSLAFSPDGQTLASGGEDSTIKFWHWKTEQLIASFPHHLQLVSSVAFSPDGQLLASGSHDKSIKLWQRSS